MASDNPSIISHVSVGTNRYNEARAFYEKAGWHATGEESTFSPPDPPEAALPKIEVVVTQYEVVL